MQLLPLCRRQRPASQRHLVAAPLLSRETAQLKVLDKQRQEAERCAAHARAALGRQQREMADRLEKLAGAADRTSSELRKLTVERRAVQLERRDHMWR